MAIGWVQSPQPSPRPHNRPQQQPQLPQQQRQQQEQAAAQSASTRPDATEATTSTQEQPTEQLSPALDSTATPAAGSSAPAQPAETPCEPQTNFYGESVIDVPPLSISDDEEEDSTVGASHNAAGAAGSSSSHDASAQPASGIDFSSMYSMFYRNSPVPQTRPAQSSPQDAQPSIQHTTDNPLVTHKDAASLAGVSGSEAAYTARPDTAYASRTLALSDSASLEEHPALKELHDSPVSTHGQPDPKAVPEKLQLGPPVVLDSDGEPKGEIKPVDSWHIGADKDGRGMHVTFQVCCCVGSGSKL